MVDEEEFKNSILAQKIIDFAIDNDFISRELAKERFNDLYWYAVGNNTSFTKEDFEFIKENIYNKLKLSFAAEVTKIISEGVYKTAADNQKVIGLLLKVFNKYCTDSKLKMQLEDKTISEEEKKTYRCSCRKRKK